MPHYKTACAQYKRHTHNKNGMRTIKTAYTQCKRHMLHLHWPKQNKNNNMEDKCEMSGANNLHCDINYHNHRCHLPRCVVKEEGVSIDTIKQNSTYHPGVIICFHFYCSSVFTVNVESSDIMKKLSNKPVRCNKHNRKHATFSMLLIQTYIFTLSSWSNQSSFAIAVQVSNKQTNKQTNVRCNNRYSNIIINDWDQLLCLPSLFSEVTYTNTGIIHWRDKNKQTNKQKVYIRIYKTT